MKDKKNSLEQRKKLGTERGVLNYLLGALVFLSLLGSGGRETGNLVY
jgi:hypothetical protein